MVFFLRDTDTKRDDEKVNAQMKIGDKVVSCTVVNSDVGLEGVEIDDMVDMSNDALIPMSNYKASSFVGKDISIEEAMQKLNQ